MDRSFKYLHYILLALIISFLITQLILKQIQPIQLLILALVYIVIVWHRTSIYTYRMALVIGIICILKQSLDLLYFCFGQQSGLIGKDKLNLLENKNKFRNIIIVTSIWIFIMMYAMLICWRAYEKTKLYIVLATQFMQ